MLRLTLIFLLICLLAGIFGFGQIVPLGAVVSGACKIICFIALVLFILSLSAKPQ